MDDSMGKSAGSHTFVAPLTRRYIDIRPYVKRNADRTSAVPLPLIETLPEDLQISIKKYLKAADKLMSLASALLKYQFVHQTAKIPWSAIRISRTPRPHGRPYWASPVDWVGEECKGLEFNVSHQAGMVVLVGCKVPSRPDHLSIVNGTDTDTQKFPPASEAQTQTIRIGVDVACPNEEKRVPDLSTQAKLDDWIDMFSEMFSQRERTDMKYDPIPVGGDSPVDTDGYNWEAKVMEAKGRRFFTCWALKEAYIKMVGEGLLANWLTKLEFLNVLPPTPGERYSADDIGMQVLFGGRDITEAMQVELEVLQDTFILATMTRGIKEEDDYDNTWKQVDIEQDLRSCAEGICSCLT